MLPKGRRRVIRALALLFLALGAQGIATLPLPLVAPRYLAIAWDADRGFWGEPQGVLPDEARVALATDGRARARFFARLDEPGVRVRLFLVQALIDLPGIVILYGMGVALWRSTREAADAVESGLPWLVRVGWACVVLAVGFPVADAVRTEVLIDGVIPHPGWLWFDINALGILYTLLIAAGVLAATWTIAAGLRARADIAEIV